jgi:hypothetical protein
MAPVAPEPRPFNWMGAGVTAVSNPDQLIVAFATMTTTVTEYPMTAVIATVWQTIHALAHKMDILAIVPQNFRFAAQKGSLDSRPVMRQLRQSCPLVPDSVGNLRGVM